MEKTDLMTGYETRLYKGWQKTASDTLKDKKMCEATLRKQLGFSVETVLPTGEVINIPVIDLLILKKLGYDIEHPEKIDLKVYSTVLGETKQEVVVSEETASDIFKGVVAGAKPNDSNTGQGK